LPLKTALLPNNGEESHKIYHTLMGIEDDLFKIAQLAIDINDTRGMRAAQLVRDALRNMDKIVAASQIGLLGGAGKQKSEKAGKRGGCKG
jgi:hypothetical protein